MLAVKIARRQQSVGCLTFRALSSDQHPVLSSSRRCHCLSQHQFPFGGVRRDVTSLLSQPLVKRRRHGSIVYFLLADVCEGFHVVSCGELCFHTFADADVAMTVVDVLLYLCIVCACWLPLLEFPENPESTHLIATHHIVTPSPRYGTRSAHPALPFPFTLPSSLFTVAQHTRHFFVGGSVLLEQLSRGAVFLRATN